MINIFDFTSSAPQDKSITYLAQLFGRMSGVLTDPSNQYTGDITAISTMFKFFNTSMLAVGALIVVYVIVVGTMKTAHEGEAMGKQWNNPWIPIRIVLGIAGLFPMASGYCMIQIVMMWVIVQGIGAADALWGTALKYISDFGFGQPTVEMTGVSQYLQFMFAANSCEQTLRVSDSVPNTGDLGNYYCNTKPGSPVCGNAPVDLSKGDSYAFGEGVCGTLTYCNLDTACSTPNSVTCAACQGQHKALEDIISQQQGMGKVLAQADFDYRNFYYNSNTPDYVAPQWIRGFCGDKGFKCCLEGSKIFPQLPVSGKCQRFGDGTFPDPNSSAIAPAAQQNASDEAVKQIFWPYQPVFKELAGKTSFIDLETQRYKDGINDAITSYYAQVGTNIADQAQAMQNATSSGWLFAGAFYYTIGQGSSSTQRATLPRMNFTPGTLTGDYDNIRINNKAAEGLLAVVSDQAQAASGQPSGGATYSHGLEATGIMGPLTNAISSAMISVSDGFTDAIKNNTNPMFSIQKLGTGMLITVEVLFAVFLAITLIIGFFGNSDAFVLGTGIENPIGPMMILVYIWLIPALYGLMGILCVYGGTLSIYVPLIPYVVFLGGVITWFLLVLEAMVAGPLVALGIMMPSGHHEIMGKAEPALLMLLNIFLRPSLMVFGMLAGMLLSFVLLNIIFYTFWSLVIPSTVSVSSSLILSMVFYLGAFVSLVVTVINKSYAAIYLLPERVITWIGGHAAGMGIEAEAEREVKGATDSAARGMGGAASAAGGGPKASRDAAHSGHMHKQQQGDREESKARQEKQDQAGQAQSAAPSSGGDKSGGDGGAKGGGVK